MLSEILVKADKLEHEMRLENIDTEILSLMRQVNLLLKFKETNRANRKMNTRQVINRAMLGIKGG